MEQTLLNEIVARVAAKRKGARPLRPPQTGMTGRACCCSARR